MTPDEHREVFTGALYEWLELNGVAFESFDRVPFTARLDLNALKVGMVALIEAFGGRYDEPAVPRDAGEVLARLLTALPRATWAGMEKEPGYVFTVAGLPDGKRYRIDVGEAS